MPKQVPAEQVRIHNPTEAAKKLEQLRQEREVGFRRLAQETGIPVTTLANFAYGVTRSISAENVIALARYYGMSYKELRDFMGLDVTDSVVRLQGE